MMMKLSKSNLRRPEKVANNVYADHAIIFFAY